MSNEETRKRPMSSVQKRYFVELSTAMVLYLAALFLRRYALDHDWWPLGFTLLPAVPVAFAIVAILRMINKLDELQRLIQLNAFAIAAMVTAFVSVVCGLLEDVSIGHVSIWIVSPLICGLWALSSAVLSWRYCRAGRE
jgi:hypothetical protein